MSQTTNLKHIKMSSFLCHPINASCTKKILTGLSAQKNGDFTSVVKIINHSFFGITFTKEAWEAFKFCFKDISEYFNTKNSTTPQKKHLTESV